MSERGRERGRERGKESVSERGYVRGRKRENERERVYVREWANTNERDTARERPKDEVPPEASESEWKTVKSRRTRFSRTQSHGGKGRRHQRT